MNSLRRAPLETDTALLIAELSHRSCFRWPDGLDGGGVTETVTQPVHREPANIGVEPQRLFAAGTAVKHPERGLGFVVEVVRGEHRPWRVLYDSGKVSRYAVAAMHTLTQAVVDGMQNDGRSEGRREEKMTRSLKLEPEVGIVQVSSFATHNEDINVNWDDSKNNRTTPRDPRPPTPPRGRPSTPAPPTRKGLPRTPRGLSSTPAPPTPKGLPPTKRGPPSTPAPPTPRVKFRRPSVVAMELGQGFDTAHNEGPTVYGVGPRHRGISSGGNETHFRPAGGAQKHSVRKPRSFR